jgi:hypothetical protein
MRAARTSPRRCQPFQPRRGRMAGAMNLAERQRSARDGLSVHRQAATATLIEIQTQRAALTAERELVEAAAGPIRYLAVMVGSDSDTAVRWLILLMVLGCDPAAIALTIAVAGARGSGLIFVKGNAK